MYWNNQYASQYSTSTIPTYIPTGDLSFNGYSLQNANIIISKQEVFDTPLVENNTYNIPRGDWVWFLSRYFRSRKIKLTGVIKSSTRDTMEQLIDEIKTNLSVPNALFKYKTQFKIRQTKATLTKLTIKRDYFHINFTPVVIEFMTTDSFFYDETDSSVSWTTAVSPFTLEVTNIWSVISNPQIYITFTTATSVNSVSVNIWATTITHTGIISAGDILLIDCLNQEVRLNGALQEYSWTFPELTTGINSIITTVNWTFVADITTIYRNNYL